MIKNNETFMVNAAYERNIIFGNHKYVMLIQETFGNEKVMVLTVDQQASRRIFVCIVDNILSVRSVFVFELSPISETKMLVLFCILYQ